MSTEQYVFISYSHRDSNFVLPCLNAMKQKGINLWYDEGIQAGSEWPEYIADKVVHCTKFVLFMSTAYLASQNCKRELNFAISRKKDLLTIFVEDVELSPGVEMQLGTYQSIFRKRFANDAQFCESLCNEPWFNVCKTGETSGTAFTTPPVRPVQPPVQPVQNPYQTPPTYTAPPVQPPQPAQPTFQNPPRYTPPQTAPGYGAQTQPPVYNNQPYAYNPNIQTLPLKNRWVAVLLAFFLGVVGAQFFYLNRGKTGILCFLFCWTYIPAFIGLIHAVILIFMSPEKFAEKYHCRIH